MILPSVDTCRCDDEPEKLGGTTDQAERKGRATRRRGSSHLSRLVRLAVSFVHLPTSMNENRYEECRMGR